MNIIILNYKISILNKKKLNLYEVNRFNQMEHKINAIKIELKSKSVTNYSIKHVPFLFFLYILYKIRP